MTKIVFLYSEIAGYFLACVEKLAENAQVMIIRWPTNTEAPFEFENSDRVKVITKQKDKTVELTNQVIEFSPDMVVCSGWMDKDYLKIVKTLDKKVIRVMSLDNHWKGTLKQRIAALVSPFYLKRYFTHAWVPGTKQAEFAKRLGFGKHTLTGFYCANTPFFDAIYTKAKQIKSNEFPKRFIYVARYVEHKGIFELWEAFKQIQDEIPSEWELWCLGTGEEWENKMEHPKIKHVGFVQPNQLEPYICETGVYILPSKFEPWGVSVQEFAISGFPLILSDEIGSREVFFQKPLDHEKIGNGFEFKAGDLQALKKVMLEMMSLNNETLLKMSETSHELGMKLTTEKWAKNLLSLIEK
ncbi:MAG: glycosyltransferase [Crocinitomix sp.]|nr:glycosyltransferase [Crocinitomix sp.]